MQAVSRYWQSSLIPVISVSGDDKPGAIISNQSYDIVFAVLIYVKKKYIMKIRLGQMMHDLANTVEIWYLNAKPRDYTNHIFVALQAHLTDHSYVKLSQSVEIDTS